MKIKRGITILCFSILILFSISFISAGFFNDLWNGITGKVTATCTDSDGGLNYTTSGTACSGATCYSDSCANSKQIFEFYCGTSSSASVKLYNCTIGCLNGACIPCRDYYADADNDGYGDSSNKQCLSAVQGNYKVTQAGDCNDANANINAGATEICGDNIDNDCDGSIDEGCTTTSEGTTTPSPSASAADAGTTTDSGSVPVPSARSASVATIDSGAGGGGYSCTSTSTGIHLVGPAWVGGAADFSDSCFADGTSLYDYSCDGTTYTHTTTTCAYGCSNNACNPAPWWAANKTTPEATESTPPPAPTAPASTDPCPGTQTQCGTDSATGQCTNCDERGYALHWCGLDGDRHAKPYRCNSNKVCQARGSVEIEDCGYGCWSLPTVAYTLCLSCRQSGDVTGLLEKSKCCSKDYRCSRMGIIFCREYKCT